MYMIYNCIFSIFFRYLQKFVVEKPELKAESTRKMATKRNDNEIASAEEVEMEDKTKKNHEEKENERPDVKTTSPRPDEKPQIQGRCYKCGLRGHVGKDCHARMTCWLCGERGHTRIKCPQRFKSIVYNCNNCVFNH